MITGIASGFSEFDRITAGFQPSDLILLAGQPGVGKTTFALDIARHAAIYEKVATVFFSLDLTKEELGVRLLSAEAGVAYTKIKSGNFSEKESSRLNTASESLSDNPIFIDDFKTPTLMDFEVTAKRLKDENSINLIIIDYLQLINQRSTSKCSQLEFSDITRGLKRLAKTIHISIILLSKVTCFSEDRVSKKPLLADLREFGPIEPDTDMVAFVYRDEICNPESEDKDLAEILIRKHRNGPTGEVKLRFNPEFMRFENYGIN